MTMQRFLDMYSEISGELPDPTQGQVMERCQVRAGALSLHGGQCGYWGIRELAANQGHYFSNTKITKVGRRLDSSVAGYLSELIYTA